MNPPFLVIRPGLSFWVETAAPDDAVTTLQAFQEGCYSDTRWYDTLGGRWTVVETWLKRRRSLLDRVLAWRHVPVGLRFCPRAAADLAEAKDLIREILQSESEFCDFLDTPPADLWAQVQDAPTMADVIRLASGAFEKGIFRQWSRDFTPEEEV